jgi:hypothetical protein
MGRRAQVYQVTKKDSIEKSCLRSAEKIEKYSSAAREKTSSRLIQSHATG